MNNTPLRYPGGKTIMTKFFDKVISHNNLSTAIYCEPYAGGAGSAINLLLSGKVSAIKLNDISEAVYSFWKAIVEEPDRFIERMYNTPVTLSQWQQQRTIFKNATKVNFDLGFATFFLSRTNRSGILFAGPIGGQNPSAQATANYKIDCRFNKSDMEQRILRIKNVRENISVSNLDAIEFLKSVNDNNHLLYLDPPYYNKGQALYLNFYKAEDHLELARFLKQLSKFHWVLSYDNVPEILDLYADFPLYQYSLSYTAQVIKHGSELLTHSHTIEMPDLIKIKRRSKYKSVYFLNIA